jgi:DNA-binding CsgD family transcriptional regulator
MTFALRNDNLATELGSMAPLDMVGSMTAADPDAPCLAERSARAVPRSAPAVLARRADGPGRDADRLSSLIGQIYDAAIDPELWPDVLAQTAEFVGGMSCALYYKDAVTKHANVYYQCGRSDPHYRRLYFESYIKIDPTFVGLWFRDIGKPLGVGDILDLDEFYASRFYQEYVRPQKRVDAVSVALDKTGTGAALFSVFRLERHGLVDAEARRRMALIAPHVRRAALVGRAIEHTSVAAATLADTLDGLSAAIFLVDADGRFVHANASGHVMLRERFVLRSASGRLAAADARASRALIEAVAAAKGGDAAVGSRGIAVPLTGRDGGRYVAHALPLSSSARRGTAGSGAAVAALFVRKVAQRLRSAPEVMAKTFNLTPSELRVLLAVVDGGGVSETAEALGIGQATVKTHLHRLFGKTGTRRQSELVKLTAGFSSPLIG